MNLSLVVVPMIVCYLLCNKSYMISETNEDSEEVRYIWYHAKNRYVISTLIITFIISILIAMKYTPAITTYIYSIVIAVLLVITAIDSEHHLIPNSLILILLGLGIFNLIVNFENVKLLVGGFVFSTIFSLAIYVLSKGGIGGGDVKLLSVLGLLLGYYNFYFLVLIAFALGTIVALIKIVLRKATFKDSIAFGPYIALAFVILSFV